MSDEPWSHVGGERMPILLSAIDNALRNGSYMTGANAAFRELCVRLGVPRDQLPPFDPRWNAPRCQEPTCPNFGDPDFGEATCPEEHAIPPRVRDA